VGAGGDALVGQVLDGRYEVLGFMAEGGYGAVFRARQRPLGRDVALKVVHTHAPAVHHERLQREARVLASLDHPRVVPVHDGGVLPDGRPYLVESFIEGRTLGRILRRDGPLVPARVASLAGQLLDGLSAVHRLGVVHRDVKPGNIMITAHRDQEALRLIDFGIARSASPDSAMETLTVQGLVIGSPSYMAPEQIMGGTVGPAADLYAVGVVLFEMLAGCVPFKGGSVVETLRAHLEQPLPALPASVPGPLRRVVARALAKSPAERFESADAMLEALNASMASSLGLAERYTITELLGTGAFGEVLLGVHRALKREVAIKVGHSTQKDADTRFVREAQILSQLQHPGLTTLREFGVLPNGRPYMVQDRVSGRSLRAVIDEGPLPVGRAVAIAIGMLEPVEVAHAAGVVHRDLKPENVMVEADDHVRVIDFGLARSAEAEQEALTTQGLFVGTVAYGAPEQSLSATVTPQADLYAIGIVLYEMVTGARPFDADQPMDLIFMHRDAPLPALPAHVPEAVAAVVRRATEKQPADRFASAAEMADALRATSAPPKRLAWIAAVAVAVSSVALILGWALWPQDDAPVIVRIGAGPAVLAADVEQELTRCRCERAFDALQRLAAKDAPRAKPLRARWEAACAGSNRTCIGGQ